MERRGWPGLAVRTLRYPRLSSHNNSSFHEQALPRLWPVDEGVPKLSRVPPAECTPEHAGSLWPPTLSPDGQTLEGHRGDSVSSSSAGGALGPASQASASVSELVAGRPPRDTAGRPEGRDLEGLRGLPVEGLLLPGSGQVFPGRVWPLGQAEFGRVEESQSNPRPLRGCFPVHGGSTDCGWGLQTSCATGETSCWG